VDAYDPATNTWEHKADMTFARSGLAAATGPDGRIYAMGGAGLNVVEAYTPATNTWTTVTPMSTTRINFGAATGSDGRIYAIGGRPNVLTNEVNTVEAFDTATRLWTPVAPMKTARWRLAAAASGADGRIYAIGGRVGGAVGNDLAEVQAFRPGGLGAWQDVAPLNTARQQLAAASAPCPVTLTPGCVYAIGGSSGPDYLKSVERFTPPTVVRCTVNGVTVTSSPVNGTPGNDAIDCSNSTAVTINGGGGNDVIRGGSGNDQINGDAGNDSINGGGGNDTINGGDGNDSMNGGAGTDTCNGGPGTDSASTCESTSAVP
jgi:Ca2+-binding RTX toxin-like protein